MRHVLALGALALLLPSCATLSQRPIAAQIVVQQATLRFIGSDPERAAKVAEMAEQLQALVSAEPVTVDHLQAQAIQALAVAELELADQHLAEGLILLVAEELRARVGDQTIPPPGLVEAEAVLGWVVSAARLASS